MLHCWCCNNLEHKFCRLQPAGLGLNFRAPSSVDIPEYSQDLGTHTVVSVGDLAETTKLGTLMYNESVQLVVRPKQHTFIEQRPDMFLLKQLDVVRCMPDSQRLVPD